MRTLTRTAAALLLAPLAWGAVTPEQAARLGRDLTPLGAERAASPDGSIPEWTGGIRSAAEAGFPAYVPGAHHPDPYAAEQPLFTITAANLAQYASRLTAGHQALFRTYPDYRMRIYPTHRSAAVPAAIAQATAHLATTVTLAGAGGAVSGGVGGIPFPIPQSGLEVFWNQRLRYRGAAVVRQVGQAALSERGTYRVLSLREQLFFPYYTPGMTPGLLGNRFGYRLQEITAPAAAAGEALLVQETLDQVQEARRAWTYNPRQRRVLQVQAGFDVPGMTPDRPRGNAEFGLDESSPQGSDWQLLGKQELYVPYNSYQLQSETLRYWDLLHLGHINQDYARYELHRVWVLGSSLRGDAADACPRRTLYVDEDSWQILAADCYVADGELSHVLEAHVINYYEVPTIWTDLELVMDLRQRRYEASGLQSQEPRSYDFSSRPAADDFQPSVLERRDVR